MCDEWKDNFQAFYDWAMSNGYQDNLTIDRIDVNGNYEPNNCRWVDYKTQSNNTTRTIKIEINGIIKSVTEWCEYYNISYSAIQHKHHRYKIDYRTLITQYTNERKAI